MRYGLIAALLLTSLVSHASKIIGNGGVVLVCPNFSSGGASSKQVVRLLDFWEAENLHQAIQYGTGHGRLRIKDPGGATYQEKVRNLIRKVSLHFPQLAVALEVEFNGFESHKGLFPDVMLEDTDDAFSPATPRHCHHEQIAIQNPPMFPPDPWFIISEDLWDQLDELGRAGLAVHESLYRIAVRNGVEHSRGVRYVVGLLFSNEFDSISDEEWITGFLEARIPEYELLGFRIPLFVGAFSSCSPAPGSTTCANPPGAQAAGFKFDLGVLKHVTYSQPRTVRLTDRPIGSLQMSLLVSDVDFDFTPEGTELVTKGKMFLVEPSDSEQVPHSFWFDGRVRPTLETFYGKVGGQELAKGKGDPSAEKTLDYTFSELWLRAKPFGN